MTRGTELDILNFDNVELRKDSLYLYGTHKTLGYSYKVFVTNKEIGVITALVNDDLSRHPIEGNLGFELTDRSFFGTDIPYKVTKAVLALYRHFDQDMILITTDNKDGSIQQMCERLGGVKMESVKSPEGKEMTRYEVSCYQQ
jgi:hypothetical protein